MQSLSRQLKRGNAVMILDGISKTVRVETVKKRSKRNNLSDKNRMREDEKEYRRNVTRPLTQKQIIESRKKTFSAKKRIWI